MTEEKIIKWKQTGDDPNDLIAKFGDYCLRVEQMGKRRFWWCLYYQSEQIIADDTGVVASTLKEGMVAAESAFWTHRIVSRKLNKNA